MFLYSTLCWVHRWTHAHAQLILPRLVMLHLSRVFNPRVPCSFTHRAPLVVRARGSTSFMCRGKPCFQACSCDHECFCCEFARSTFNVSTSESVRERACDGGACCCCVSVRDRCQRVSGRGQRSAARESFPMAGGDTLSVHTGCPASSEPFAFWAVLAALHDKAGEMLSHSA